MIRSLAPTVPFLLAGAVPALAQTYPRSHDRTHSYDRSGHVPLDSAQHAAMHARLLGSWTGTLSSPRGVSAGLDMSVAHDSARKVTLKLSTDRPIRAGAAGDVVVAGDQLQWTQDVSGASCRATAVLSAATPRAPETMKGRIVCEGGDITFTLLKKAG